MANISSNLVAGTSALTDVINWINNTLVPWLNDSSQGNTALAALVNSGTVGNTALGALVNSSTVGNTALGALVNDTNKGNDALYASLQDKVEDYALDADPSNPSPATTPSSTFTSGGHTYLFLVPAFTFQNNQYTSAAALEDQTLLDALVAANVGIIQQQS